MPSGYEKSPNYGGPAPELWLWVVGLVILAVAALGYYVFA